MKHSWLLILPAVWLGSLVRAGPWESPTFTAAPGFRALAPTGDGPPESATSTPGDNAADNGRLAAVLPRGMTSQDACRGLKSLDLCAATLHAAQNLDVPFADLKRQLAAGQGLDAAIHSVKPAADTGAEATRAKEQALQDMRAPRG